MNNTRRIINFETCDSTNDRLKELMKGGAVDGTVVTADVQTNGRGRVSRRWRTDSRDSIAMSVGFRAENLYSRGITEKGLPCITLLAAISVTDAIYHVLRMARDDTPVHIKWPNDIVINGRKVCGILTENILTDDHHFIIVGIGINVRHMDFPPDIADIAGNIEDEAGVMIDRDALIVSVAEELDRYIDLFAKTSDMSELKRHYNERLINMDRIVRVESQDEDFTGVSMGIDDTGALMVKRKSDSGESFVTKVSFGEVSVRGVYGYV